MASDPGGGSVALGNPYIPYLAQVESAVYLRAPPGFAPRLTALRVLTAGAAAIAHLILLLVDCRRGWRSFWLFRLVPRPSGRMICTNSRLVSCLMSVVCLVLQVCYLEDVGQIVLQQGSQRLSVAWRCFSATADVSHLFLLSFAQQQAYLAGLKGERDILSARLLNFAFLGLGIGLWIATMTASACASVAGYKWFKSFEVIEKHLRSAAASWTPSSPVASDMLQLQQEAINYVSLGAKNNSATIIAYSFTTTVVATLILVNLTSLGVVHLNKRRRVTSRMLDHELLASHDLTLNPISTTASSTHGSKTAETKPPSEHKLSTTEIRNLAAQKHTMAGVQAQQLLEARKAERDLTLMALWCGGISCVGFGLGIWVTVPLLGQGQWQDWANWPLHEAALTLLQWLYATLLVGLYPSLITTAWRNLSPRKSPCRLASKVDYSLPSPFHRTRSTAAAYRSAPRAGAAPSGRVRVIVEEHTREEYRHDLPSLETTIEGGFVPTDTVNIPATGAPKGGVGLGVAWVKPSWAVDTPSSLAAPEPVLGKRSSKASSLRWEFGARAPMESTAAHEVTPWAWYERRPSS